MRSAVDSPGAGRWCVTRRDSGFGIRDDSGRPRDPAFPNPQSQIPNPGPPSIRPGTDAGAGSPVSSRLAFSQGSCVTASTLAFVFPGQGSQSLAMLAELSELHPLVRVAFAEASDGAGVRSEEHPSELPSLIRHQ